MPDNTATTESWEVLQTESVLERPFLKVALEQVRLPNGRVISDWPKIHTNDFVNAVVFNEDGDALVLEGYRHGTGWSSWQMLGDNLREGEEPLTAVQRNLLEKTGHETQNWTYLGSYVVDANQHVGVGHYFCAQNVKPVQEPTYPDPDFITNWVPVQELRFALLDGRIAVVSHAISVSLALLTVIR